MFFLLLDKEANHECFQDWAPSLLTSSCDFHGDTVESHNSLCLLEAEGTSESSRSRSCHWIPHPLAIVWSKPNHARLGVPRVRIALRREVRLHGTQSVFVHEHDHAGAARPTREPDCGGVLLASLLVGLEVPVEVVVVLYEHDGLDFALDFVAHIRLIAWTRGLGVKLTID